MGVGRGPLSGGEAMPGRGGQAPLEKASGGAARAAGPTSCTGAKAANPRQPLPERVQRVRMASGSR